MFPMTILKEIKSICIKGLSVQDPELIAAKMCGWLKLSDIKESEYAKKFASEPELKPESEPELKVGMKCDWLMLPNFSKKRKTGYNPEYIPRSYFSDVTVIEIYPDRKYVKLRGKIAYGYKHTKWYSIKDIIDVNYGREDILRKFK